MKISNEEADERAREEFPFKPRWRPTTTSEAKTDDREQYLLSVIAALYEKNDSMRRALTDWRQRIEDACLDNGWSLTDTIDEILGRRRV